ncbi:MAG: bifunctional molybdenum cofactor biosynthesis protein MoaC/MoaB, partial [Candidatus Neomarinimicrobiota bacterium]|nr:bifunctional molybdenum cofactor biosynthesis protein MoaC/MoaB [Candidatus Neomarinimicrobiota bacterium]
MNTFSHLDKKGNVRMVDVTDKVSTTRVAKAKGQIAMLNKTISAIQDDTLPKGNVLTTAKISGVQAAKKTAALIPMCHQLNLTFADIEFDIQTESIVIKSTVKTKEATGVEMEALTAVSVAALTIYDMCKAVDKTMTIGEITLVDKKGGASGHAVAYRPAVGIITMSDGVAAGKREDKSGKILSDGFAQAGCAIEKQLVLPDGSEELRKTIKSWIDSGVELIITTGGTGLGPRDLTIPVL